MKILGFFALGLLAALVLSWLFLLNNEQPFAADSSNPVLETRSTQELAMRVAMLESQLAEEVILRQQLEELVDNINLSQWSDSEVDAGRESNLVAGERIRGTEESRPATREEFAE